MRSAAGEQHNDQFGLNWHVCILAAGLACIPLILWASLSPSISSEVTMITYVTPNAGGDTQWYQAWAKSETWGSGNFNGGKVFGLWNDGSWGAAPSWNVGFMEVIEYPITGAGSMSVRNQMTGYGQVNTHCFGGASYHKTAAPWVYNGNTYVAISCLDINDFHQRAAGIIISPDGGLHWCNWKTYQAGGNTCTSSNWDANGDAPVDAAGYQWYVGDFDTSNIHSYTRNIVMCQDNTVNCPTVAGMDNANNLYFLQSTSLDGTNKIFARSVPKNQDLMDPANWKMWNGSAFVADSGTPTDLIATYGMPEDWTCCVSIAYLPAFNQFIGFTGSGLTGLNDNKYATASLPWGTWSAQTSFTPASNQFGWDVIVPWGFTLAGGHLRGVMAGSNATANGVNFYNWDFGTVLNPPGTPRGITSGKTVSISKK